MKLFNLPLFLVMIAGCSMLFLFTGSQTIGGKEGVIQNGDSFYLSNRVIVKLKEIPTTDVSNRVLLSAEFMDKISSFSISEVVLLFPSSQREAVHSLANIIEIRYTSNSDPLFVSLTLSKLNEVEWAEPRYLHNTAFVPDDPNYSLQWNLQKIKAEEAWDVTTGDTSVVIAIIDTGVDWDHPDISGNLWINHAEIPNNGIDDDGNGYIDDYIGWDFGGTDGTPDNDPREDRPDHGTHVAGISSAVTNNNVGIASIGYRSKIMAVKTSRDDMRNPQNNAPYIVYGYEGIVYAADNGADVINCSWGSGNFSRLGQETINYATNQGALIVGAAGNSNVSNKFYPAAYDNVLAVASTDQGDLKSAFSNYGTYIDVSAPGSNIYSTWQKDTYKHASGTSMAAPLVAGLAGLVKAQFPHYTPEQLGQQVRVTADNIDGFNPSYDKMLGRGRINAFKAVSTVNAIAVRAIDVKFSDDPPGGNGNGAFEPGEQCTIEITYVNYLSPISNLAIYAATNSQYVNVNSGIFNAGAIATLDTFTNQSSKIVFTIATNVPANTIIDFVLTYGDGANNMDFQWISTTVNPSYATQAGNKVALTITSKGTFGFNDYYTNLQGDGFRFDEGSNLLFEGSFMYGTSATKVVDGARGATPSSQNNNFEVVQPFIISIPGNIADQQGSSVFNDNLAGTHKLGITSRLSSYSFVDELYRNYIILHYKMLNTTDQNISNLFCGLFFDWDMIEATGDDDFTAWDPVGNLGYLHNVGTTISTYVGSALISSADYGFWGILNPGGDGGFSIYDDFTKAEKWQALSSGIGKAQAGAGDVSHVISGGPFLIPAGEEINVAFVVAAGEDLNSIRASVQGARIKYLEEIITNINDNEKVIPDIFMLHQNYPNPFNPSTKIKYSIPQTDGHINGAARSELTSLIVYNILGNRVATLVNELKAPGMYEVEWNAEGLSSGVYFYRLQTGEFSSVKKLILMK